MEDIIHKLKNTALYISPDRITDIRSWQGHIPFAFAFVKYLHPEVLVELGTHKGDSYCAFCQAVDTFKLNTKCFAVDTWKGDEQAGYYGDEIFEELKTYHSRYKDFSTLRKMNFDEALGTFKDASIDLLHIDGHHAYESVRHDVDSWLPKMSPNGIILLHDTCVRDAGFGVWRVMKELKKKFPYFEFLHSNGLGVLGIGENIHKQIKPLFNLTPIETWELRYFFDKLGREISANTDMALASKSVFIEAQPNNIDVDEKSVMKSDYTKKEDGLVQIKSSENSTTPIVSVIIPAYNHEKYVMAAVESVISQTLKDIELIVINDGSTDNTLQVIEKITDPRVSIFTQNNQGAATTINAGIGIAKGRYVTILNSDDLFTPDRLFTLSNYLDRNPSFGVAVSRVIPIDNNDKIISDREAYGSWLNWYGEATNCVDQDVFHYFPLLIKNFIVTTSNIFVKRSVFENNKGFEEKLRFCHDYEFLLRVVQKESIYFNDTPLLKYRLHDENTIRKNDFVRHLEMLHSIFSTTDIPEICFSAEQNKLNGLILQALKENPDVNPEPILMSFQHGIEKKSEQLEQAGTMIHNLQSTIDEQQEKLKNAGRWLQNNQETINKQTEKIQKLSNNVGQLNESVRQYSIQINNERAKLATLERQLIEHKNELKLKRETLEEIYSSKGWLWLTRLWRIKEKLFFFKKNIGQPIVNESKNQAYQVRIKHPVKKNRPKIIHVIANLMVGGSSRLVVDLIEHLGHQYDQEIATLFIPTPPAYFGLTTQSFTRNTEVKEIVKYLKRKKTDILHIHYWGECDEPWYKLFFEAAEHLSCKVIENINTPVAPFKHKVITKYVYVSNYAKHYSHADDDKSIVIYPGSNFSMFHRDGAPIPDNNIGMVYRLEGDKLSEDAIEVFIKVVQNRPQTRCYIIGGGTFLDAYRQRVEVCGLSDNFVFTGYVPYAELPELYKKLSVFVAPVWKESFGQVSPFAMHMNIPVAGYDVGALSEILENKECLGNDLDKLSKIIVDLLDDRNKRLEIGKFNHERANAMFSVETMIRRYEDLYSELLMKHKSQNALSK